MATPGGLALVAVVDTALVVVVLGGSGLPPDFAASVPEPTVASPQAASASDGQQTAQPRCRLARERHRAKASETVRREGSLT